MSSVSFLLGAGFSKPAGYPLASELNDTFRKVNAGEIGIHSDSRAWFNLGKPIPNDRHTRVKERMFFEQLIDHYTTDIVAPEDFHYEDFYDWYKSLLREEARSPEVEAIAEGLGRGLTNLLLQFDLVFNQLLAQELRRWYPEVHDDDGLRYESEPGNYHPSFLPGTRYKMMKYASTPYYTQAFKCFKENLRQAELLIIIGYGFETEPSTGS